MSMPQDDAPVTVEVEVPGPDVDDFELVAEVGEEPPEAVELTDEHVLRSTGG